MKNPVGICALCGKVCDLTFEHIPPQSAFNSTPAKPVSGDQLLQDDRRMPWDISGLHYSNQQRGMGIYSLRDSCNNNTGAWYGSSYVETAYIVHYALNSLLMQGFNAVHIKILTRQKHGTMLVLILRISVIIIMMTNAK